MKAELIPGQKSTAVWAKRRTNSSFRLFCFCLVKYVSVANGVKFQNCGDWNARTIETNSETRLHRLFNPLSSSFAWIIKSFIFHRVSRIRSPLASAWISLLHAACKSSAVYYEKQQLPKRNALCATVQCATCFYVSTFPYSRQRALLFSTYYS